VSQADITLAQYDYPTPGTATFALYFRDVPQDSFQNPLNRIATTFTAPRIGTPPPAPAGSHGTTKPGSTQTTGFVGGYGGGGGGGGCAVAGSRTDGRTLLPLGLLAFVLIVRRRRRR
jgi:MYXO-CTERM domain-containing protein